MATTEFDHKGFTAALPRRPGVYRMFDAAPAALRGQGEEPQGPGEHVFRREQRQPESAGARATRSRDIEVTVTNSETEALLLEYNLIKEHKPRFNVVLRDDKSFPTCSSVSIMTSRGSPSTAARAALPGAISGRSRPPGPYATR